MPRNNWTREETILALTLYCNIPFGRINKTNSQIVNLASRIGRTPSALAMKMCNFSNLTLNSPNEEYPGLLTAASLTKKSGMNFTKIWKNHI